MNTFNLVREASVDCACGAQISGILHTEALIQLDGACRTVRLELGLDDY